jgi:glutamyl-tRNA reductase
MGRYFRTSLRKSIKLSKIKLGTLMLIILGVNHTTAPLTIRERFASVSIADLQLPGGVRELVIIATCNRTEWIAMVNNENDLQSWLQELYSDDWQKYSYCYLADQAVLHVLRVACGLDSMILGEPQILGQMKAAFTTAAKRGLIGNYLGHLFPFVFSVAKKVRSATQIGANSVSIAYTAVNLAKSIFADLKQATVLLIGAGETIRLVAQHLHDIPVKTLMIANRTLEKSEPLAQQYQAMVLRIGDIPSMLAQADIVISSTASQLPLLGKGLLERVCKQRKHKPIFMVDLAMPRDIEPEVGDLPDVYLYNVDDLQKVVQENLQHRQRAAEQAEAMLVKELARFLKWHTALEVVPTILRYREKIEQLQTEQVAKALHDIRRGKDIEAVIHRLAHNLTQKLMHAPTVELRRFAFNGDTDALQWAKQLLQINEK